MALFLFPFLVSLVNFCLLFLFDLLTRYTCPEVDLMGLEVDLRHFVLFGRLLVSVGTAVLFNFDFFLSNQQGVRFSLNLSLSRNSHILLHLGDGSPFNLLYLWLLLRPLPP